MKGNDVKRPHFSSYLFIFMNCHEAERKEFKKFPFLYLLNFYDFAGNIKTDLTHLQVRKEWKIHHILICGKIKKC